MNDKQENYFTFAFNIDPELNSGYTEAFKQGDEPWWWYTKGDDGPAAVINRPAAGPVPNFTGATFKSLHQWSKQILP